MTDQQQHATIAEMFSRVSDGLVSLASDWRYVWVNDHAERFLGVPREQMIGRVIWDVFPGIIGSEAERMLRVAMETGAVQRGVLFSRTFSIWLRLHCYPSSTGLTVFFQGVNERTRDQAERDRFFNLSPDLLGIFSLRDLRWTLVNDTMCRTLGYDEARLTAPGWIELVHEDDRSIMHEMVRRMHDGESLMHQEMRVRHKLGRYLWLTWNAVPDNDTGLAYFVGRDTTQRREAEESLARNRTRFESIFRTMGDAAILADPERRIILVNPAFTEIFGYEPEEVIGRTPRFLYTNDEDYERMGQLCYSPHADTQPRIFENEYRHKDGRTLLVESSGRQMVANAGRLIGYVGIHRDVTSRKRAERELEAAREAAEQRAREAQEGKRFLDAIMESIPIGIMIADAPEGRVRLVSRWACEILGTSREALMSVPIEEERSYASVVLAADGTPMKHADLPLVRALRHGETINDLTAWLVKPDGEKIALSCTAGPIRDTDGNITGAILAWTDIRERLTIETSLRESRERFRMLADNMAQLAWMADADGRAFWFNKRWIEYAGTTFEQIDGWEHSELVHPDHRGRVIEKFRRCIEAGTMWEDTFPLRAIDGSYRWFLAQAFPIRDEDGHVLRWFGTKTDVTVQLETMEALRRSQSELARDIVEREHAERELKELNETLEERIQQRTAEVQELADQLRAMAAELTQVEQRERRRLAAILHDHIQQLLVGSLMMLERLKRDLSTPESLEMLQSIQTALRETVTASRSLTVELSPPVLQEAGLSGGLAWLAAQTEEKGQVKVTLEVDEAGEPTTEELRHLLFESVRELLFNVLKHADARNVWVQMRRLEGDLTSVVVRDDGRGYERPSSRHPVTETRSFGLFSIQQRLTYFGGRMEIQSKPGEGTRVELIVPQDRRKVAGDAPFQASEEAGTGSSASTHASSPHIRVLLVDDHQIMREGLAGIFAEEDDLLVIGEADNGLDAVDLAVKMRPDVVVLDINLPQINGIEVTRILRERVPEVSVIGLSMHFDQFIQDSMLSAGAVAYLSKGDPSDELLAAIRRCGRVRRDRGSTK